MKTNLSVPEEMPSIVVYHGAVPDDILFSCLYGIEEEGVPYRLEKKHISNIAQQSYEASCKSLLEVGIAIDKNSAALHYMRLPQGRPLFLLHETDQEELRILGTNAARMVKGIPFVLKEV